MRGEAQPPAEEASAGMPLARPDGAGEAYDMRLTLDLRGLAPASTTLDYVVSVRAKKLGDTALLSLGEAQGQIACANAAAIVFAGQPLAQGMHRIEALVRLAHSRGPSAAQPEIVALMEGRLLQVY